MAKQASEFEFLEVATARLRAFEEDERSTVVRVQLVNKEAHPVEDGAMALVKGILRV